MKSNGWPMKIAMAIGVFGLAVTSAACTKSSESKGSTRSSPDDTVGSKPGELRAADPRQREVAPDTEATDTTTDKLASDPTTPTDDIRGTTAVASDDGTPKASDDTKVKRKNPYTSKTVSSDDSYRLEIRYPNELASGTEGTVMVTVIPAEGWHMNKDFPTKLTVEAPDGVKLTKEMQKVPDAVEFTNDKAVFAVKFTSSSAGAKAFSGKFKFAVCTSSTCDPKRSDLAWNTSVI